MEVNKSKYNNLIKNIEIINVLVRSMDLKEVKFPEKDKQQYRMELKYKCEDFNQKNEIIEFYPSFSLKIICEEKVMVELKFQLRAIYKLHDIVNYDESYILEFINRNVPVNIWPYAREIISSITTRIGYPTLVIDPYRVSNEVKI